MSISNTYRGPDMKKVENKLDEMNAILQQLNFNLIHVTASLEEIDKRLARGLSVKTRQPM